MTEDEIVQKHKEEFNLLGDFLDVLDQSMSKMRIDRENGQQVMMALLAERLRSTARACTLVAKNGFSAEARVLVRVCLEITFKLQAIYLDKEYVQHYANEILFVRKKALTVVTVELAPSFSENELTGFKTELKSLENQIKARNAKKKDVPDWAAAAKLPNLYVTYYKKYCGFVHAGATSMGDWSHADEAETGFELTETLWCASICVKQCLIDLHDQFSLDLPLNFETLCTNIEVAFTNGARSP